MTKLLHNYMILAVLIFSLTYITIISEKINRTTVALFGAILMIVFNVISQEHAFEKIDLNTIGLLIGMMMIVNVLKRTGIFEYLAIATAKFSKGDPWKIILLFSIITAVSSALLDNVTTILLIAPVTLVITDTLRISPIPFLVSEVLAANIGGTATLIGDPPNIMIGGATDLGFLDFLINLGPIVVIIFVVTMFILKLIFKRKLHIDEEYKAEILKFDLSKTITNKKLLIKSLIVLGITILGFVLHQAVGLESATVALFGGVLLLLISRIEPEEILLEIEWTTIFFFIGLFILVGALEERGIIEILAGKLLEITNGQQMLMAILILWVSAIASAFLDNIPFVATMIPLIQEIETSVAFDINPLWWALALGACLGGNGTLVGATANVIVAGLLEKKGQPLSFGGYMKIAFPIMILSIILATVYIYFRYL